MSVLGYPQPGKLKSQRIVEAFVAGCGGKIASDTTALGAGEAAFFGVVGIEHLLRLAIAEGRTFYYGDNSFFDVSRGKYFRFAKNALQVKGPGKPDMNRLAKLYVKLKPWRKSGDHIVVVEQSEHFMKLTGMHPLWLARVVAEIRRHTDRPIRVRRWARDKVSAGVSLQKDLKGAWALVTQASAAANESLMAGVPVFVGSKDCVAASMGSGELSKIETPRTPDGREDWAAGLAAMQWTLDELREGAAWKALQE